MTMWTSCKYLTCLCVLTGDLIELIRSWRRDLFNEDLKGWLRSATIQEALSASDLAAKGIVLKAYPPMARTRHQGRRQDQVGTPAISFFAPFLAIQKFPGTLMATVRQGC